MASTLLQLKDRSRQLSDMEDSNFISDEELTNYINQSALELYDLLVATFEDYYINDSNETTLTSGQDSISVPADFYKLRGVDFKISADRWVDLKPFSFQDRNEPLQPLLSSRLDTGVKYRLQGNSVVISPTNKAEGTYKLWYVPKMTQMTINTDTLPAYLEPWDEYVVVDAAIKMLQKEESSTTAVSAMKDSLKKRIEAMAHNRDAAHPEVILPSSRRDFWWWGV